MHRTSARPATLNFPFPPTPSAAFGIDQRRDIGLHSLRQLTPQYFEAPPRDGLRTPPADDMTTYQHAQYSEYAGRPDATYAMSGPVRNGYVDSYPPVTNMQAKAYPALGQPLPLSASTLRQEIQVPLTSHRPQPQSPQHANKTGLAAAESMPTRKHSAGEMTTPSLKIPSSVNNSGGSLAEFAAQVIPATEVAWDISLIICRLHAYSGSSQQKPSSKPSSYRRPLPQ
jgi:hypothetical protein